MEPTESNPIQHLIVLTMENRSFDHFLGSWSLPAEGRTDIDGLKGAAPSSVLALDGTTIPAWCMDGVFTLINDPPHGPKPQNANWNGGANDGFVQQYQRRLNPPDMNPSSIRIPMGFYTRRSLPVTYSLADRFTICDQWFCSMLSSTWPNRRYLLSGRRDGDDDTERFPLLGFRTTPFVRSLDGADDPATGEPLTWKSYFCDAPFLGFWFGLDWRDHERFQLIDAFSDDCAAGTRPTVSLIDPAFAMADDHPCQDPRLGQKFLRLVVDALSTSQCWQLSALIVLYDENGGFFDHVAPPPPPPPPDGADWPGWDDSPLGFRVPALVISPWARRGACSHLVYEHTTVMRSITDRWGVQFPQSTFGHRCAAASSIWEDCFDFDSEPLPCGVYTAGAELDAVPWSDPPKNSTLWELFKSVLLRSEMGFLPKAGDTHQLLDRLDQRVRDSRAPYR